MDQSIKEKFDNRSIMPSASAWERLSDQLDQQAQKKSRGWFFYFGIAASILLIVSLGIQLFTSTTEEILPKDEFVVTPEVKESLEEEINKVLKEIPEETVIVTNGVSKEDEKKSEERIIKTITRDSKNPRIPETPLRTELIAINTEKENDQQDLHEKIDNVEKITEALSINEEQNVNTQSDEIARIKIDPDDLLYAVTHSPEEVKSYYAKYSVDRTEVLKTISKELNKSNIKMDAEAILAEVEQSVLEEQFESNFLKLVKEKVTGLASTIANRNYREN